MTLASAQPAAAQFTPYPADPRNILEGNWQSCRERDGQYTERVYDHVVNGVGQFEVHLGPRREFAIFTGVQDAHRDHDAPDNLLKPFRVVLEAGRAKRRWEIPSLNLVVHGDAGRRLAHRLRELVHPARSRSTKLRTDVVRTPPRCYIVRLFFGRMPKHARMGLTIATIVCAYNESRLLPACLYSLLAQTRPPDDILVINNASTDETGAVARAVPGVRVVDEPCKGLVVARETARLAAHADILAYVDADCRAPITWLERVEAQFSRGGPRPSP